MDSTIFILLQVAGSLAFFIYGMKLMSEGIQRAAGAQLRSVLRNATKNRLIGLLIGFFTTLTIQSSSATTVLIISFVNGGLITLGQSLGLILGANIGTTGTAWLIALLNFQVNLYTLTLPILAIGVPMIFVKQGKLRYWGDFLIGLAVMLLALHFLQESIPEIKEDHVIFSYIQKMSTSGLASNILFIFIGIILTIAVQSSSAAIALFLTMCMKGYVPFEQALFLVLGTNIGTTLTAEIAAIIANNNAKRAARLHTLFNVLGVLIFIFLMPVMNAILVNLLNVFGIPDPNLNLSSVDYGLAAFHTLFNVINAAIFLIFGFVLIEIAVRLIPNSSSIEKEVNKSKYLASTIKTSELAIVEIKETVIKDMDFVNRMISFNHDLFMSFEPTQQKKITERIKKYRKIAENMHTEIQAYINSIYEGDLSTSSVHYLKTIEDIAGHIKSISTHLTKISQEFNRMRHEKIWVSPTQRKNIVSQLEDLKKISEAIKFSLDVEKPTAVEIENFKELYRAMLSRRNTYLLDINNWDFGDEIENDRGAEVYEKLLKQFNKCMIEYHNIIHCIEKL